MQIAEPYRIRTVGPNFLDLVLRSIVGMTLPCTCMPTHLRWWSTAWLDTEAGGMQSQIAASLVK